MMSLMFGNLTQDFVSFSQDISNLGSGDPNAQATLDAAAASFRHNAALDASYLTYIGMLFIPSLRCETDFYDPLGVGMFVCTYIYMDVWVYTAEVAAKRLREAYLRAVLRQDIVYFDNVGAGEVATRIQTDTR